MIAIDNLISRGPHDSCHELMEPHRRKGARKSTTQRSKPTSSNTPSGLAYPHIDLTDSNRGGHDMRLLPFVSIENRQLHLSDTNNRWRSGRGVAVALGRRVNTPQIAYRVAICPRGNLPYIQITSIVLPYSQSTKYLL